MWRLHWASSVALGRGSKEVSDPTNRVEWAIEEES